MATNGTESIDNLLSDTPIESPYRSQLVDFDSKLPCSPDPENPMLKNLVTSPTHVNMCSPVNSCAFSTNRDTSIIGPLNNNSTPVLHNDTDDQTFQPCQVTNSKVPTIFISPSVYDNVTVQKAQGIEYIENKSGETVWSSVTNSSYPNNNACFATTKPQDAYFQIGTFVDGSVPFSSAASELYSAVKVNLNGAIDQSECTLMSSGDHSNNNNENSYLGHTNVSCEETNLFQNNNYNPISYKSLDQSISNTSTQAAQNCLTCSSADAFLSQGSYNYKNNAEVNNNDDLLNKFDSRLESNNGCYDPSTSEIFDYSQQPVVKGNIKCSNQFVLNPSIDCKGAVKPNFNFENPVYAERTLLYNFSSPNDILPTCRLTNVNTSHPFQRKEENVESENKVLVTDSPGQVVQAGFCNCLDTLDVPFEQVFIYNGQMYQLPYSDIVQIGKFQFYSFLKEGLIYIPLGNFFRVVGKEVRNLFASFVNLKSMALLSLSLDEIYFLEQKCSFYFDSSNKDLIDLQSLREVCLELLNICPGDTNLKMLAVSIPSKYEFRSNMICSNCGCNKKGAIKGDSYVPLVGHSDFTSKISVTVGTLMVGDEVFTTFDQHGRWYVSFKDLVTRGIISLTALQDKMKRIHSKAIIAPPDIEKYFSHQSLMLNNTLWIEMVTLRCVVCMINRKSKLAGLIACGEYSINPSTNILCEDTSKCNITYSIDAKSLTVDKNCAKYKLQNSEHSFFITRKRKERASKVEHSSANSEERIMAHKTRGRGIKGDENPKELKESDNVTNHDCGKERVQEEGKLSADKLDKDSQSEGKNVCSMTLRPRKRNVVHTLQETDDEVFYKNESELVCERGRKQKKFPRKRAGLRKKKQMYLNEGDYIVRDYETFCQKLDAGLIVKRDHEEVVVDLYSEDKKAVCTLESLQEQDSQAKDNSEWHKGDPNLLNKALHMSGIASFDFDHNSELNDVKIGGQHLESKDSESDNLGLESISMKCHDDKVKAQTEHYKEDDSSNLREHVSEKINTDQESHVVLAGASMEEHSVFIENLESGIVDVTNPKQMNLETENENRVFEIVEREVEDKIKNLKVVDDYHGLNENIEDNEMQIESKCDDLALNLMSENTDEICDNNKNTVHDNEYAKESSDLLTSKMIHFKLDREEEIQNNDSQIGQITEIGKNLETQKSIGTRESLEQRAYSETEKCSEIQECLEKHELSEAGKYEITVEFTGKGKHPETFKTSKMQDHTKIEENQEMEDSHDTVNKLEIEKSPVTEERTVVMDDFQTRESIESGKISEKVKSHEHFICFKNKEVILNSNVLQNEILDSRECLTESIAEFKSQNIINFQKIGEVGLHEEQNIISAETGQPLDTDTQTECSFSNDRNDFAGENFPEHEYGMTYEDTELQHEKTLNEENCDTLMEVEEHNRACTNGRDITANEVETFQMIEPQTEPQTCSQDNIDTDKRKEWETNIIKYLVFSYVKVGPNPGFKVLKFLPGAEKTFPDLFDSNLEPPETKRKLTEFKIAAGRYLDNMFLKYRQKGGRKHPDKRTLKEIEPLDTNLISCDTKTVAVYTYCSKEGKDCNVNNCVTKPEMPSVTVTVTDSKGVEYTNKRNNGRRNKSVNDQRTDRMSLNNKGIQSLEVVSTKEGEEKQEISAGVETNEFLSNHDSNKTKNGSDIIDHVIDKIDENIGKENIDNSVPKTSPIIVPEKADTGRTPTRYENRREKRKHGENRKAYSGNRSKLDEDINGNSIEIHENNSKETIGKNTGIKKCKITASDSSNKRTSCRKRGRIASELKSYKNKQGTKRFKHSENITSDDTCVNTSLNHSEMKQYGLKRKYQTHLNNSKEKEETDCDNHDDADKEVSSKYHCKDNKKENGSDRKVSIVLRIKETDKNKDAEIREIYDIPDSYVLLKRLSFLEDAVSV